MITTSLVSGGAPQKVQIVIDGVPAGEEWVLTGHVGSFDPGRLPGQALLPGPGMTAEDSVFTETGYSWRVPGGFGVSDGGRVVLVDNRAPGNVPVVYRLDTGAGAQSSLPVTVDFVKDVALQTLDGQRSLFVDLLAGSADIELPTNVATFRIPGRPRPVTRYDVLGDVVSTLRVLVPLDDTTPFRSVLSDGGPILYRLGRDAADLDRVAVIQVLSVASTRVLQQKRLRAWDLGYIVVDDPDSDVRLGAYAWSVLNTTFAGRPWADFEETFADLTWADFDTTDWAVV